MTDGTVKSPLILLLGVVAACCAALGTVSAQEVQESAQDNAATEAASTPLSAQPNVGPALDGGKSSAEVASEASASVPVEAPQGDAPVEKAAASEGTQLGEVVVTAQRRSESLQETPVAIATFDSKAMETAGIANLEDIGSKVPNVSIQPFPVNSSTLTISIRGVGFLDSQISQDSPVGVYIDGIYVSRTAGLNLELADLERIEILKGPQGTLWGRNSTGGAISIVTKRPSLDGFAYDQKLSIGNEGLFSGRASVNVPVTDDVAMKIAGLYRTKGGFVKNGGPGPDYGDTEISAMRYDVRWKAMDDLLVDYGFDYTLNRFVNPNPQAIIPNPPDGTATDTNGYADQRIYDGPGYSSKRRDRIDGYAKAEWSKSSIPGHTLTIDKSLGDHDLKYLLGYRKLYNTSWIDIGSGGAREDYRVDNGAYTAPDGTTTPSAHQVDRDKQWSHEVLLSGSFLDGEVDYISGFTYLTEKGSSGINPLALTAVIGFTNVPDLRAVALQQKLAKIDNSAYSGYLQTSWKPTWFDSKLKLTGGVRYSNDHREATNDIRTVTRIYEPSVGLLLNEMTGGYQSAGKNSFDNISFTSIVGYQISDDVNVYAKRVEGYKTGGFNVRDPNARGTDPNASFGIGFDSGLKPETVTNYEGGIKSDWFDRRLRINTSIFLEQYKDQQFVFDADPLGNTKMGNAASSDIKGVETDVDFVLTDDLVGHVSGAYLHPKYNKIENPTTHEDLTDQFEYSRTPKWQASLSLDWTVKRLDKGTVALHGSFDYVDRNNFNGLVIYSDQTYLEARKLVNARLDWSEIPVFGGTLTVAAWGKNLTDQSYATSAIILPHAARAVTWGDPRSFGLDVIFHY